MKQHISDVLSQSKRNWAGIVVNGSTFLFKVDSVYQVIRTALGFQRPSTTRPQPDPDIALRFSWSVSMVKAVGFFEQTFFTAGSPTQNVP